MSLCAAPIKGTVLRIVKLDACGVVVTGAAGQTAVIKGFTQVQSSPQYEDGNEFFERTADGSVCVNQKDPPILKRFQLTVDLCTVDPDMISFVLSARELATTTPVSGYGFVMSEGATTSRFSLEVWQQVAGSGACDSSGVQRYIYNAWPHCGNGRMGNYTIENNRSTFQFQAESFAASTLWSDGPGTLSWLPVGAANLINQGTEHYIWNISTVPPPLPYCGNTILT